MFRKLRFRIRNGFPESDIWNLDLTIALFAAPRLKAYIKYEKEYGGTTGELEHEEWIKILEHILWAFEYTIHEVKLTSWMSKIYDQDFKTCKIELDSFEEKRQKGLELFAKYFNALWD